MQHQCRLHGFFILLLFLHPVMQKLPDIRLTVSGVALTVVFFRIFLNGCIFNLCF